MSIEYHNALEIGYELHEYNIEEVLGVGGFGITYLASDKNLHHKVAIKEFLPEELVVRKDKTEVVAKTSVDIDNFKWGLERFLQEAITLAQFKHPNIVRVSRFFEANGTAYFVMDYEEGLTLEDIISKREAKLTEEEILNIITPILDGLREVHKSDFLHRDIKPSNIFIRKNSTPMLIDFGAARYAISNKSKSITQMLTPGYAPAEQYLSDASKQGAFSDIYSIGAVMYKLVTGETPIDAPDRNYAIYEEGEDDPLKPAFEVAKGEYSDNLLKAIDWALNTRVKDRPQSVSEFQEVIYSTEHIDIKKSDITLNTATHTTKKPKIAKKSNSNKSILVASLITVLLAVAGGAYYQFILNKEYGYLTLKTEPNGANIVIDGTALKDKSPLENFKVEEGGHTLKILKDKYVTIEESIKVEANSFPKKEFKLDRQKGEVTINSKPNGADIYINNQKSEYKTPATLSFETGKYDFYVEKEGYYKSDTSTIDIEYKKSRDVELKLKDIPTYIVVIDSNIKNAKVYIDDNYKGVTPFEFKGKKSEKYKIEIKKDGYKSEIQTINLNENKAIKFNLKKILKGFWVDHDTGLMWQNQPFSKEDKINFDNSKEGGRVWKWSNASKYCNNIYSDGYSDWRLPTREELKSLITKNKNINSKGYNFYIKKEMIENMPPLNGMDKFDGFWSQTESSEDSDIAAWYAGFHYGYGSFYYKSYRRYVLCVRDK